jgi:hypothetical protein
MKRFSLESKHLQREVLLDIVIPDFEAGTQLKLLVLNDGQDAHSFQLPNVMNEAMATGIIQAEHSIKIEPHMDLDYMGEAFLHMGQPPLKSNILFMSIMITNTPFISKG